MTIANQNSNSNKDSGKFLLTVTALAGILGSAALGAEIISSINADNLAQLAAVAVPGVMSWIISYLIYKKNFNSATDTVYDISSQLVENDVSLLTQNPAALPEIIPGSRNASATTI